ncbi:MAG: sigma-70 family RNA polymerase sigma factor [Deltaproteobacteria bacterium]|nr:sigma-70 family RNA polymerase sigma factor [Deltaproteobacteria bacterium]
MTFGDGSQQGLGRPSDLRLVEGLLAGDSRSVEEVRRWVRGSASGYRRFLANELDDLEQEILLSLMTSLSEGGFRHECSLKTFVRRMVHNSCIDLMRAAGRRQWINVDDLDLAGDETRVIEALSLEQESVLALRIAASLSKACRDLWRMIHQGLSYEEMAARTGASRGALRVRVLRCRRKAVEERDRLLEEKIKKRSNAPASPSTGSEMEP